MDIYEQLFCFGLVPVVKIDDAEKAVPLAKALADGGLSCAEITFRTEAGKDAIRRISKEMPEMLVGAGTVLSTSQVDEAVAAGAKFIVSPGLNPSVVSYCIERNIPVFPGCTTPSDMEKALELGLTHLKFFPAEQSGGVDFLKAVSAPYTMLKFMPTGGINEKNLVSYLSFEKIIACGGSWMVKDDLINNDRFAEITEITRTAIRQMLGFEFAHIGINCENADEALKAAKKFEALFGFAVKEGNSSIFAGKAIECMKEPFLGAKGHIAISTNNVKRAMHYLKQAGFDFNYDTEKKNAKGATNAIYLNEDIFGYAVHLLQK